jgi:hypothetical protein
VQKFCEAAACNGIPPKEPLKLVDIDRFYRLSIGSVRAAPMYSGLSTQQPPNLRGRNDFVLQQSNSVVAGIGHKEVAT